MPNNIGNKLKQIRLSLDLQQNDFAALVGIETSHYNNYENNFTPINIDALHKIVNHPKCLCFTLWLMTDTTNIAAGQIAPNDPKPDKLIQTDYEKCFSQTASNTLLMFCHLDWFTPTDKVDFSACGKLLYKDLKPIIEKEYQKTD